VSELELCEHCGAKLVEYRHGLSKGLMRSLYKLARAGGGQVAGGRKKTYVVEDT
jgi:hypothetical protein